MQTPVLFIVFNRPDLTLKSLAAIREARPTRLFIAADGPRKGNLSDEYNCGLVRELADHIDWDCEVFRFYRSTNLGCRVAVKEAIDWFFEQVEEGIIIEDDCLAGPGFFNYADKMLSRFRNDFSVGHISGVNFTKETLAPQNSFSLINHAHIWGWATWKRVWQHYRSDVFSDGSFRLSHIPGNILHRLNWFQKLHYASSGTIDTWDYQYQYLLWSKGYKSVIPSQNLVSNIGFDERATHTRFPDSPFAKIEIKAGYEPAIMGTPEMAKVIDDEIYRLVFRKNWFSVLLRQAILMMERRNTRTAQRPSPVRLSAATA